MTEHKRTPTSTHWGSYDVLTEDGRIVGLEPAAEDPYPSPIGSGMASAHYDPSRITQPMIRRGWLENGAGPAEGARGREPFVAVSWEQALDLVAAEIERVRSKHGNQAIYAGSYGWASAGRFHHAQSQVHRFMRMAGGYTDSVNSYSFGAMEVIMPHVVGGSPYSLLQRGPTFSEIAQSGELVVSFGGMARKNASVHPGGLGRHNVGEWERACRDAGVHFVNISPLQDDAATEIEADWIPLRPGTDVALMLALAHEIVAAGLHDKDFLDRCCVGFDVFADYLTGKSDGVPKTPEWAQAITEVPADQIAALARRIAESRTVINVSWSIQRIDHGEQTYWMAATLSAISGSFGMPGGGMSAGLGIGETGVNRARHRIAALPQGENPVDSFIPCARIADMLLNPGEEFEYDGRTLRYPKAHIVYWVGGNPFHHHQDLHRLVGAWQQPDTVIVHEPWWNANARFADVIFPIATTLERNDFAAGMSDLTISASHKAVDPPPGVLTDYETFAGLAARLGFEEQFTEGRTADEWVRELYERTRTSMVQSGVELPEFDDFWAAGRVETPPVDNEYEDFAALRKDPEKHPLSTPSGKLEIFSKTIDGFGYDDCPGHPTWMEPAEWLGNADRFPLQMVSNQPSRRLHSQYDNGSYSREDKINGREPVLINTLDAGARNIADGDTVRLFNDRGACLAGARVTDSVREGVVVLATGAWFDPVDPGVSGSLDRHGNPNVLTRDAGTSKLAQASTAGTVLVQIERAPEDLEPPAPFEPPEIVYRVGSE